MQLDLASVNKRYGEIAALDDVSLKIGDDVQTLVLIGPSGGGKSTLLRVVAGLETPDSGEVIIEGDAVGFENEAELREHRKRNGFVFQAWNLFPHLSALENVVLPLIHVHGISRPEAEEIGVAQLKRFQLEAHIAKQPAQLSGGQQQRVALARAIAPKPRLLLLDEPTSALDPEMTAEVLELIEELCREGQNILLSTHEMGFARAVADQIVFLAEGKALAAAGPDEIFEGSPGAQIERFIAKVMRY
ncbi:MAG: polar amino acid transport system ATP-binding protein [Verrucomicrobiales bacterium]|jgi:polar amino acid transport system ATP-binding protein